jgi:hypothetical protein
MDDVLMWLGLLLAGSGAAAGSALVGIVWALRRRNRVDPRVRTPAPTLWLVSPTAPARLHRRLQATAQLAASSATTDPAGVRRLGRVRRRERRPTDDLLRSLRAAAVELDAAVIHAARLPLAERRDRLADLTLRTQELERSAERLARLGGSGAGDRGPDRLSDLDERLTLLEAAHRELRTVGLNPPVAPEAPPTVAATTPARSKLRLSQPG